MYLDVNVVVLAKLCDDCTLATDDLGVIFWLDVDFDLETLGLAIRLLTLQLFQSLHERLPGLFHIWRRSGDDNHVRFHFGLWDLRVKNTFLIV